MALLAPPDVVPATREGARQYARHKPEETLLFQAVQEHLSSFLCEAAPEPVVLTEASWER
jgi:hypothetical protein